MTNCRDLRITALDVLLGHVALGAQWPILVKLFCGRFVRLCICASVSRSVGVSVCPVHCGKMADRIQMLFGIIGRTGPGMRQIVGFGDRFTGKSSFGGEFGAPHCNQCGLYGVRVRQCLNRRSCRLGWFMRWAQALLY